MITYHINRFIHSIIRENKLYFIMELLLSEGKKEDILFTDFIKQLKHFLMKENEVIFDDTKLKYIAFIEDFKHNVDNIKHLKNKDNVEVNSLLYRLYDIPKKRNNLLLVFLLYFYINNKNKLWGEEIFKIIYVYFMIIVYRNRVSRESRKKLIDIDKIKFRTMGSIVQTKINNITKKHSFLKSGKFKLSVSVLGVLFISAFGYFNNVGNLLKADILNSSNNAAFGKVAFDSIMVGRVSDNMLNSVQGFGLQNILLIVAFALLIQSLKTSISTVFFNSLLTKIFHFSWLFIKYIYRAIFYVYDYITYKLETKFIFMFVEFILGNKIAPGKIIIGTFAILYGLIYLLVVYLYLFFFVWVFSIPLNFIYIIIGGVVVSFVVIYANFHNDLTNFKSFMIETELIIKDIYEKAAKDSKEKGNKKEKTGKLKAKAA